MTKYKGNFQSKIYTYNSFLYYTCVECAVAFLSQLQFLLFYCQFDNFIDFNWS